LGGRTPQTIHGLVNRPFLSITFWSLCYHQLIQVHIIR